MDLVLIIAIVTVCINAIAAFIILCMHYVEYKKSAGQSKITFKFLFVYFAFLASLLIILPTLATLALYCQIVALILKIKHGSKFAGLLEGTDAIHTLDEVDPSKNVGNILFVIRYDGHKENFYETMRAAVLQRFRDTPTKTPKLWYTWHQFSGYSYYLKNQVAPEECVRKLEKLGGGKDGEEISKEELLRLLSVNSNKTLPRNHSGLWEVLIGTQPVQWKADKGNGREKYYPVVLRIHHCLSDATQLLMGFVRIFGDVKTANATTKTSPKSQNGRFTIKLSANKALSLTAKPFLYVWDKFKLALKGCYVFVMIPPILIVQGMIKAVDDNVLHGPKLSGEKHLVFGVEETPHYIQSIKKMKKRMAGTAFSEILLAAISASFAEYFQNNSKPMPDTVAAMVPVFPGSSKLANFLPANHNVKKFVCRNKFSLAVLNLPVRVDEKDSCGKCNAINTRLALVREKSAIFKNSIDFQVNYLILSGFVGLLPLSIRRFLSNRYRTTCMVSILPAPPAITALDGYGIQDVVFWVPNRGPIGMGFSIMSYDGRFQMGVIADKALIPDQKDVQNIVDGIYKYLDLLDVETDCSRV